MCAAVTYLAERHATVRVYRFGYCSVIGYADIRVSQYRHCAYARVTASGFGNEQACRAGFMVGHHVIAWATCIVQHGYVSG
jgi:hypothetical protein